MDIENLIKNQISNLGTQSKFDTMFFPMIKSIVPSILSIDEEKLEEIKSEIKSVNRDNKIKSIEDDTSYEEMKIEDHPDYDEAVSSGLPKIQPLSMPSGKIFHIDYMYDSSKDDNGTTIPGPNLD